MNSNLESKISNFFVVLLVYEKVRNSWLLRAIHASNLNILNLNLFRPDLIRGSLSAFCTGETVKIIVCGLFCNSLPLTAPQLGNAFSNMTYIGWLVGFASMWHWC